MSYQIKLYRLITRIFALFAPFYLKRRAAKGKELTGRIDERFGKTEIARPTGTLIWLHAASVGESVMLLPLIKRLLGHDPNIHILLTSGTVTSAELMARNLPERAQHQFVPIDTPRAVEAFLDHWRPDLGIFAESEIWPNLIMQAKARAIKLALINARISQKSLARWQGKSGLMGPKMGQDIFSSFELILPADETTAQGLSALLERHIAPSGNLKYAGAPLQVDIKSLAAHRAVIGDRPVWVAASTHEGEDEILIAAHKEVLKRLPQSLLILVPRHPERGAKLEKQLQASGLGFALSAYAEDIDELTNIILIAKMGVLGLAYRLANTAFIGGSLLPELSGHNPLEPARLDCSLMSGPYRDSFADIYDQLEKNSAVYTVSTAAQISATLLDLFARPSMSQQSAQAGAKIAQSQDGGLDMAFKALSALLPPPSKVINDSKIEGK